MATRKPKAKTAKPVASATKRKSKQQRLIDMLHRPDGATIPQMSKAFGWEPHTVRGGRHPIHPLRRSLLDLWQGASQCLSTRCNCAPAPSCHEPGLRITVMNIRVRPSTARQGCQKHRFGQL